APCQLPTSGPEGSCSRGACVSSLSLLRSFPLSGLLTSGLQPFPNVGSRINPRRGCSALNRSRVGLVFTLGVVVQVLLNAADVSFEQDLLRDAFRMLLPSDAVLWSQPQLAVYLI